MVEQFRNAWDLQTLVQKNRKRKVKFINDSPITYLHWLTHVANNKNVISHLQSILIDIQRASEEEDMEYEELISAINGLTLN